jgi:oxygen-dependent protoporphyrinogen oxidase
MLFTYFKSVMELIRELGLEEEIEYIGMSDFDCEDCDKRYPISFAPNAGLLFNPALKLSTRLRLVNLLPDLIKARFVTNPDDMTTSAYADNESMEDYFTRKVGADFVSKVANPLFRGARNWNADDVSPAFF